MSSWGGVCVGLKGKDTTSPPPCQGVAKLSAIRQAFSQLLSVQYSAFSVQTSASIWPVASIEPVASIQSEGCFRLGRCRSEAYGVPRCQRPMWPSGLCGSCQWQGGGRRIGAAQRQAALRVQRYNKKSRLSRVCGRNFQKNAFFISALMKCRSNEPLSWVLDESRSRENVLLAEGP